MMASASFPGTWSEPDLSIGSLKVASRAFLAPMSGVTDLGMRRAALKFGAGIVVSEMVASDDFVAGHAESRIRAEGAGVSPHIVQIAGRDPHWMGQAARLAEASGADAIDINMGCPAKRVIGGLAGSALMRDLGLATDIVRAVIAAVSVPVTLKMRLGWDAATLNAADLARRAESEGVALVTVHGRTRQQFYKGRADWRAIAAVKQAVSVPVVVNGDCDSAEDAGEMLTQSGADAVMIGRGAVGRPWFVGQVGHFLRTGQLGPLPTIAERRETALDHYRTLLSLFGREQGVRHARKHLALYAQWAAQDGSRSATGLRAALVTSEDSNHVEILLSRIFDFEPALEAA